MMTVRFPDGFSIQYNRASYVRRSANYTDLYTQENGSWIAQVPNSCVIEAEAACRLYNPLSDASGRIATAVADLTRKVSTLSRRLREKK